MCGRAWSRTIDSLSRKADQDTQAAKEIEFSKQFPYNELRKLNLVDDTRRPLLRVGSLRRFFGVSSLFNLGGVRAYEPAFRQSANGDISHESLAAWLRAGELRSQEIDCAPFDSGNLHRNLSALRRASRLEDPNQSISEARGILASAGVALVVIQHFPKTRVHGATFWTRKDRAILMMSLRGSWADVFWFSLFHELGHLLLHGRRTFLEHGEGGRVERQEKEADKFAQDQLIPPAELRRFLAAADFSDGAILGFASEIEIAPGNRHRPTAARAANSVSTQPRQSQVQVAVNPLVCRGKHGPWSGNE